MRLDIRAGRGDSSVYDTLINALNYPQLIGDRLANAGKNFTDMGKNFLAIEDRERDIEQRKIDNDYKKQSFDLAKLEHTQKLEESKKSNALRDAQIHQTKENTRGARNRNNFEKKEYDYVIKNDVFGARHKSPKASINDNTPINIAPPKIEVKKNVFDTLPMVRK